MAAATLAGALVLVPGSVSAEGLFDFLFGGVQKQARQAPAQANFFADPFGINQQPPIRRRRRASRAPGLPSACEAATANIFR